MAAEQDFMLEVDGPGASPESIEPASFLSLAAAWFRLASKVSEASRAGLVVYGLEIRDKCIAASSASNNPAVARAIAERCTFMVAGDTAIPDGAIGAVEDVRKGIRGLRTGQQARARVGTEWSRALVVPGSAQLDDGPWETTGLRVVPRRINGGEDESDDGTVLLVSGSEDRPFKAEASIDDARLLGSLLLRPVDVDVRIRRGLDGRIARAQVLTVYVLDDKADPVEAWRTWAAQNLAEWGEIDDVPTALGRRD